MQKEIEAQAIKTNLLVWVIILFFLSLAVDTTLDIPFGPYGLVGDFIHKVSNGLFFVALYNRLTFKS